MVKARFELECFVIDTPFGYGRIPSHKPGELCIHTHNELRQRYYNLYFWKKTKNTEETDKSGGTEQVEKLEKCVFIDVWLRDEERRTLNGIVVDPTCKAGEKYYNLWQGFKAAKLPPVSLVDEEELMKPIKKHILDVIANGNETHMNWILDYLGNMIQRPEQKTQVAISLYGAQGTGKGIIFEKFRLNVLGSTCSFQTSKPEDDLFGRFGNGCVNCVCVQVDEVKCLHDHADRLKDLITNPTLNYEKKGRDTIVVDNYVNLILTSNNANALTVTADDRRFVLFHCSPVYKGNPEYFNHLGSHLDRPEVARAFYQHCLKRDLSPYPKSFQFSRPITDYYREAQRSSIPVLSRFISACVSKDCPESILARQFYQRYETFRANGNYKFVVTESTFAKEIKKINGIQGKHTKHGKLYDLDPAVIKRYLEDMNEYDPDAEL